MQQGRPSTSPQPVITPSAGASLPSIARCEECGPAWIPISTKVPGVDEQVDALARGQLAALVLDLDLLLAPAQLRLLAARVQVVHQSLHAGLRAVLGLRRRFRALRCPSLRSRGIRYGRSLRSGRITARRFLGFASGSGGVGLTLLGLRLIRGHAYLPFHSGSRFSKKAVTPSIASSVPSSIVSWEQR